jgi:hypothetical protein
LLKDTSSPGRPNAMAPPFRRRRKAKQLPFG